MNLAQIQSAARVVSRIALDIYDSSTANIHLEQLARVRSHTGGGANFELEWTTAFPQLRQWVGSRKVQESFQGKITGKLKLFEITEGYDRLPLELGDPLAEESVREIAEKIAEGFLVGKERLVYDLLLANPVSYDGQDFFDTDHTHPDGKPYSNLLDLSGDRADSADPTPLEVRKELKAAKLKLLENRIVRNRLVDAGEINGSIRVITRGDAAFNAFHSLLTEDRFAGGEINSHKGTFSLSRDFTPPAGMENSYEVLSALPGGPRPLILVVGKEFSGVEVDESKKFSDDYIPLGGKAIYGVAGGFPQTIVRVE